MAQDGVTGVSCALIRNGKIVWTRGFGITNCLRPAPVTPQTVFSAASLGKAVCGYLAMKRKASNSNPASNSPMQTPQVRVNEHVSWGLGIGMQHSE
ncbi:MAG: serine hydrolase, partial [bacterium]